MTGIARQVGDHRLISSKFDMGVDPLNRHATTGLFPLFNRVTLPFLIIDRRHRDPTSRAPIASPRLRGADRPTDRISLLSVTVTVAVTVTVRQVTPCQALPPTGHLAGHQPLIVLKVKVNRLAPRLGPKGGTGIGLSGGGYSGNLSRLPAYIT